MKEKTFDMIRDTLIHEIYEKAYELKGLLDELENLESKYPYGGNAELNHMGLAEDIYFDLLLPIR